MIPQYNSYSNVLRYVVAVSYGNTPSLPVSSPTFIVSSLPRSSLFSCLHPSVVFRDTNWLAYSLRLPLATSRQQRQQIKPETHTQVRV